MSTTPTNLSIQSVTIDNSSWTPVKPPFACDNVAVTNQGAVNVKLRILSGDPTTELIIGASTQQLIAAPKIPRGPRNERFPLGQVAFYLQSVSGTGPVLLLWA